MSSLATGIWNGVRKAYGRAKSGAMRDWKGWSPSGIGESIQSIGDIQGRRNGFATSASRIGDNSALKGVAKDLLGSTMSGPQAYGHALGMSAARGGAAFGAMGAMAGGVVGGVSDDGSVLGGALKGAAIGAGAGTMYSMPSALRSVARKQRTQYRRGGFDDLRSLIQAHTPIE